MKKYFHLSLVVLLFASFILAGCTKYAKQADLDNLKAAEEAALAAEKQLKAKQAERAGWEKKLTQKESERDVKQAEKEEIEKNLGTNK